MTSVFIELSSWSALSYSSISTITGKWKLTILWLLNQRGHRFGELRRAVPGITQHMLTTQLRELESDGLIRRKIFAEVPPRVEYAIAPAALALKPVIDAVFTWWRNHGRAAPGKGSRPRQPQGPESAMISTRAKIKILAAQLRMTWLKH